MLISNILNTSTHTINPKVLKIISIIILFLFEYSCKSRRLVRQVRIIQNNSLTKSFNVITTQNSNELHTTKKQIVEVQINLVTKQKNNLTSQINQTLRLAVKDRPQNALYKLRSKQLNRFIPMFLSLSFAVK